MSDAKMKARDEQIGGDHYKNMGVEPWDVVDTWPLEQRIGYYRGGALKYIMRMGAKDENAMEIRKGAHYLRKLAEVLDEGRQDNDDCDTRLDETSMAMKRVADRLWASMDHRQVAPGVENKSSPHDAVPIFNSLVELHDAGYRLTSSNNETKHHAILNGMIVNVIRKSNHA